jgi:hypothetical protein
VAHPANQIDQKKAALLLYALQTASSNLRRTKFEPRPQQVVINPRDVPDTSLGDDAWYNEEFAEDEEEQEEETKTSAPAAHREPPAAGVLPAGARSPLERFRLAQDDNVGAGSDQSSDCFITIQTVSMDAASKRVQDRKHDFAGLRSRSSRNQSPRR